MGDHRRKHRRAIWFATIVFYAVLLIASHVYQYAVLSGIDGANETKLEHVILDSDGSRVWVFYDEWLADDDAPDRAAVLLLHGSPGNSGAFGELGPLIAQNDRLVIAPDLPGYGRSSLAWDLSYKAQARYMMDMLDALGVGRVHVVGWSSSGGVAIEMADQFPDRVATITLLAGIGAQETEGTGSYFFEHVKYGVGYVGLGVIPELIPHFGYLGRFKDRAGWLKAFWDSDQRELSRIMPTIEMPVLILQGRHDFLVMDWAAERHYELMPTSKLVMLDASHFLPFLQTEETAGYLNAFFNRHDQAGVAPETGYMNLAPRKDRRGFDAMLHRFGEWVRAVPWLVQLAVIVVLIRWVPYMGLVATMVLVTMLEVDFGVAILGMMVGRGWWLVRGAGAVDRPWTMLGWVRGVLFILPVYVEGVIVGGGVVLATERFGLIGFVLGCSVLWVLIRLMRLVVTWEGRQRIKGWVGRCVHHEYWAAWVMYLPVLWWGVKRIITGAGIRTLGAVNPGYSEDGGVQGESKEEINTKLGDDPAVLVCVLIEPDEDIDRRIALAVTAIETNEALGGLPVICKPDVGERGRGVQVARTIDEVGAYCRSQRDGFVLQRFHPGAFEIGVLWVRDVDSIGDAGSSCADGWIYAITIKGFPEVVGDGRRTLRRLILRDRRHRRQAAMFFDRLVDGLETVPGEGERVSLGFAGNHAQGAKFSDGRELITEELTRRIGQLVSGFQDDRGRGFDIGRFDLRFDSIEALKRGEGFGIVELNGVTSEPTNLYDPDRSIFWAWGVLLGYWKHIGTLSAARIETGTGEAIDKTSWKRIKRALVRAML